MTQAALWYRSRCPRGIRREWAATSIFRIEILPALDTLFDVGVAINDAHGFFLRVLFSKSFDLFRLRHMLTFVQLFFLPNARRLTLILSASFPNWARSYATCNRSHVSAPPPKALSSRIAISGDILAWP